MPSTPLVSVVVPTQGRPELARALTSVLAQDLDAGTPGSVEIVVVADLPDGVLAPPPQLRAHDRFVVTGGRTGGGNARNTGIATATGRWIAFLDDDDAWAPQKLRRQVEAAERLLADGVRPLVACRHVHVDGVSGARSEAAPTRLCAPDQPIADYLFRARRPGGGRASLYTSTLLVAADDARACRWDPSLPRHQDWDWVLRLEQAGLRLHQVPDALVDIHVGSSGSISAGADWSSSLAWADAALRVREPRAYVDFVTAQTLR